MARHPPHWPVARVCLVVVIHLLFAGQQEGQTRMSGLLEGLVVETTNAAELDRPPSLCSGESPAPPVPAPPKIETPGNYVPGVY